MSDDNKEGKDSAHQTMPPELRPFAKPQPEQRLVAPENEAEFKANLEVLSMLNGGPKADPFYVDPQKSLAFADRAAPQSTTAYVPPVPVPAQATSERTSSPAKVVIADRRAGSRTADKPQDMPASPWATDAPVNPLRQSALPSSLGPQMTSAVEEPPETGEPRSDTAMAIAATARHVMAAALFAIFLIALVIGLGSFVTTRHGETAAPGHATTMTASGPDMQTDVVVGAASHVATAALTTEGGTSTNRTVPSPPSVASTASPLLKPRAPQKPSAVRPDGGAAPSIQDPGLNE